MSEVALPQPVPNISSTATMVSAADCLINGEASLSQPQSQIQPHLQSQLPSQSRKRSFDGARNYDEGTANGDSNEIESERKTDAGFPSEVMIHKAGNGEACGTIGGDSEEPHQQTVFGTASTSAIAAGSATAKEGSTPLKRRKVTPQEKEEKKLEKEERERERAEMRARKDKERKLREDERRKKEEEKKLKEDERRKKAEEREEERKLKEEERRKREEEKEEKKREKEAERLMIEEEKKMKERVSLINDFIFILQCPRHSRPFFFFIIRAMRAFKSDFASTDYELEANHCSVDRLNLSYILSSLNPKTLHQ